MSIETAAEVMISRIERLVREKVEDERRIAELLIREDTLEGTIREMRAAPTNESTDPGIVVCNDCRKCAHVMVGKSITRVLAYEGCFLNSMRCRMSSDGSMPWLTDRRCPDYRRGQMHREAENADS